MILIVTHKEDYTADFVIDKLNQKNIKYLRFNTEDSNVENIPAIIFNDKISSQFGVYNDFKSVWFRRVKLPITPNLEIGESLYVNKEIDFFLKNLWSIQNVKWLSNPFNIYFAENKAVQLKYAKEIGFKIPNTIITANRKLIKSFFYANHKNIIIKPIYCGHYYSNDSKKLIFTNPVSEIDILQIDHYDAFPSIYQANISKKLEIRVTVINNKVFSASVDSQSNKLTLSDWRKEQLKFTEYDLPVTIRKLCIHLVKKMGLEFGAIDLILDRNGDYIFLEINPNGQWAWLEIESGLKISDEIINFLN